MSGERLCIDCAEFRRKLSRGTSGKLIVRDFWFFEQSLKHRMHPKWSLEAPAAPQRSLVVRGCSQNKITRKQKYTQIEHGNLETLKLAKTHTNKSSRSVWLKSSQLKRRAIWWRKGFLISTDILGYPWIFIDINEYPWIAMDIHAYIYIYIYIYIYTDIWISRDIDGHPWTSMDIQVHP